MFKIISPTTWWLNNMSLLKYSLKKGYYSTVKSSANCMSPLIYQKWKIWKSKLLDQNDTNNNNADSNMELKNSSLLYNEPFSTIEKNRTVISSKYSSLLPLNHIKRLEKKSFAEYLAERYPSSAKARNGARREISLASNFEIGSPQKLNLLGRQIYRLSLEEAILQMTFSHKRHASRILNVLKLIKEKAERLQMSTQNMIIENVTVGRGKIMRKLDIKGRGHHGIRKRTYSQIRITLREPNYHTIYRRRYRDFVIAKENKPVYFKLNY